MNKPVVANANRMRIDGYFGNVQSAHACMDEICADGICRCGPNENHDDIDEGPACPFNGLVLQPGMDLT